MLPSITCRGHRGGSQVWGCPTALWKPLVAADGSFGIQTNQFGFNVACASGVVVVVEACTNLANPTWTTLQTKALTADTFHFGDPNWTNYPSRMYRLRTL